MDFSGFDVGNDPPSAPVCQQASRSFVPKIPTVFILVDRSGSMFDTIPNTTTNAWDSLRGGVLQVISDLQADVRFGFGAFSGGGGVCPEMPMIAPALNNHDAINALYAPLQYDTKYKDTPTLAALSKAATTLWSDTVEGDKYILYVTDGEPDYCDDGNALCPPDSVVGQLQKLALGLDATGAQQAPIHTLVFGVNSPLANVRPETLQAFANAGAGQPVAPPLTNGTTSDPNAVWDQCNGVTGWAQYFATTGKPLTRGQTTADYTTAGAGGTAPVYRPDPVDQAALITQIQAALAGVKSCSFDLAGDGVKVDLARPDLGTLAHVLINGTAVPIDATNGWHMASDTTVELDGDACSSWRVPGQTAISFDFPCDVIILR
jgi:hypothetical protein